MSLIEISPQLRGILERWGGKGEEEALILCIKGSRASLRECEEEILNYEVKYGISFEEFKKRLDQGEWGDPYSYELEKDTMRWEDLIAEKKIWLSLVKALETLK